VNPNPAGTLTASASRVCDGESVDLTFTASVGSGPFSIVVNGNTYNNVQSGVSFTAVTPTGTGTNYNLTSITDANGCSTSGTPLSAASVAVDPNPAGTIALSPSPICPGENTTLTFTASAGTGPFDLVINGTSYSGLASGGTITLTEGVDFNGSTTFDLESISDANGCSTSGSPLSSASVTVNPAPAGTIAIAPATICAGGTTTLTFNASVGTGPFDIVVNGVSYTGLANGGTVTLTEGSDFTGSTAFDLTSITDANGCSVSGSVLSSASVSVNPNPAGTLTASASRVCDGESVDLTFTASVGSGPFSIVVSGTTYSNVQSGVSFTAVTPTGTGTNYNLTSITDANGCSTSGTPLSAASVAVDPNPAGTIALSPSPICPGENTTLTFTASAGTGPFDLVINGTSYSGLTSGGTITLTEGVDFNGSTTFDLESISDANGCSTSGSPLSSASVTVNPAPAGTIAIAPATICAGGTTTLTFNASVGTGPFDIVVNGVSYTGLANGGTVTLTEGSDFTGSTAFDLTSITDANGCSVSGSVLSSTSVSVNPNPAGTLTASASRVCDGESVDLTFTASVGSGPFSIVVSGTTYSNVQSGVSFTAVTPTGTGTNYNLTSITDANGCSTSGTPLSAASVAVDPNPAGTIALSPSPICPGENTTLTFTASAGTGPFDLVINGTSYSGLASGGTITLTEGVDFNGSTTFDLESISDANGCSTSGSPLSSASVTVNPAPAGTIAIAPATICAGGTTTLTFNASVGTGPFDIVVNGVSYTGLANGGTVTLTEGSDFTGSTAFDLTSITDANGCSVSGSVLSSASVSVNPNPAGTLTASASRVCDGESVDLTFTASVGSGPFSIVVNGNTYNNVQSGVSFTAVTPAGPSTDYDLESITDANSCTTSGSPLSTVNVAVDPNPAGTIALSPSPICPGENTTLTFTASAGTGPFDLVINGTSYSGLASGGTITLTEGVDFNGSTTFDLESISDANGCSTSGSPLSSASVTVNPAPAGTIAIAPATICAGGTTTLTFNASVGTGPFDIVVNGVSYTGLANGGTVTLTEGSDFSWLNSL
jgi:hypothetical protein